MSKFDYNLIVIGAGSAGLVGAYIAAALKAKVLLIEEDQMGGDCLNTGCVPSKALLKSAKMAYAQRHMSLYGLKDQSVDLDFASVMEQVRRVVAQVAPHDSVERYEGLGVEVKQGKASLVDRYHVEVKGEVYSTKAILIATGARPWVPPLKGLDQVPYLTSDSLWSLRQLPKKLLVLGGGPIGCELAQAFSRLGSQVRVVNMASRLLEREDPEVSALIEKKFRFEGIEVNNQHQAIEFALSAEGPSLKAKSEEGEKQFYFDQVLVAIGRRANSEIAGLAEVGIKREKNQSITADRYMRSSVSNIYVAGDVTGPFQFTHTAGHQASYAAVNALLSPWKKFAVDDSVIPWCTYTDPEVAQVGLNQSQADRQGLAYEVTCFPLKDLDRAITERETEGFVKVITAKGKDRILGVTIVHAHAGEMIAEYVLAMKHRLGLKQILGTIHIYPTLAEANKRVAGLWKAAHAPQRVLAWVKRFHAWRLS